MACLWSCPLLEMLNLDLDEYPDDILERFCTGSEKLARGHTGRLRQRSVVEVVLTGRADLLVLDVVDRPVTAGLLFCEATR